MKVLYVKLQVKPEFREKFIEASLGDAIGSTRDEPGCYRFDVLQDDNDPNVIYFYEVYEDEDAFKKHGTMPHFYAWRDAVKDWMEKPSEISWSTSIFPKQGDWKRQG